MLEIEPYRPADLPAIERFIAFLYDAERELDARLSPGVELSANRLKQMLDDVSDGKGLVLMARVDGIAVGFGCVLIDDYRDRQLDAMRQRTSGPSKSRSKKNPTSGRSTIATGREKLLK